MLCPFGLTFAIATMLVLLAALVSLLLGQRVIYGQDPQVGQGMQVGSMAE